MKQLTKIFSQIIELITNQKNKKLQEIQLQRNQNKAFIAYEKISKIIESAIHEINLENCQAMIIQFYDVHKNIELYNKLRRELSIKLKYLNNSFNA
jgi:hypothetical protein